MRINASDILNSSILIVDDHESNISLLEALLSDGGYTSVASTMNPQEVCALHLKNSYDLILLDLQMPDMDGFQVMEALNANGAENHLPVIVLTAQSSHKLRALQAGARDFISKPFDIVEVKTRIYNMLEVGVSRKQAQRRDREESRRQSEFIATLAHELRNPLAPIRHGLEILKTMALNDAGVKVRDIMDRQITHMAHLIDDLMDVSRIASGKVELKKRDVDIRRVIESGIETSNSQIEAAQHKLTLDLPESPMYANGDPMRLAQVISNLLTNASKYTPQGGCIHISLRRDISTAIISISDNGIGIEPNMLTSIFEMFGQAHQTLNRAKGGLGIGLALTKTLVEMHDGSIRAESSGPSEGSTFVVRIPLIIPKAEMRLDVPIQPRGAKTAEVALRILVVEDNTDGAQSLAMLLRSFGHEVSVSCNGHDGIAAAVLKKPEVILLDIGLPDMNGYEVATLLRKDPTLDNTVLVAMTGWGSENDKRNARLAGFNHHLTKPVDAVSLNKLLVGIGHCVQISIDCTIRNFGARSEV